MHRVALGYTVLFVILLNSACSSSGMESYTHSFRVYKENGVTIAETAGGPKYRGEIFQYVPVVRLLEDTEQPESLLHRAYWYRMGEDGCYYVQDDGNYRIAVFDANGEFLRSIGRSGEGPGEFRSMHLLPLYHDAVPVYDRRLRRTSVFSTDGSLIESVQCPISVRTPLTLYPASNGVMVLIQSDLSQGSFPEQRTQYSALVLTSIGDTLSYVQNPYHVSRIRFEIPSYGVRTSAETFYSPNSYMYYHPSYGILRYHSAEPCIYLTDLQGNQTYIIRIDLEKERVSDQERRGIYQYLEARIEETSNPRDRAVAEEYRDKAFIPEYKAYWATLVVDELGYYWLYDYINFSLPEQQRMYAHCRVLSPEGEYLGDTRFPEETGRISRGHYLAVRQDEQTGEREYIVYRLKPAVRGLIDQRQLNFALNDN